MTTQQWRVAEDYWKRKFFEAHIEDFQFQDEEKEEKMAEIYHNYISRKIRDYYKKENEGDPLRSHPLSISLKYFLPDFDVWPLPDDPEKLLL